MLLCDLPTVRQRMADNCYNAFLPPGLGFVLDDPRPQLGAPSSPNTSAARDTHGMHFWKMQGGFNPAGWVSGIKRLFSSKQGSFRSERSPLPPGTPVFLPGVTTLFI